MSVSYTPPFNLQNNTTADATQVMADFNAVTTALQNAAASGVNSDITALTALSVPLTPAQGGTSLYVGGTSTGSANAQVLTPVVPTGFTLTNGNQVLFLGGFANGGAATLNVAGTGALPVHIQAPSGDQPLTGGEILAAQWNQAVYHSADNSYHLVGVSAMLGGIGPATTLTSQATVDLALAVNHNASITGTTTVTSFGSNADVNFPLYRIAFTGALTLTYNATSMILPGAANITTAANDSAWALYLGSGNWQIIQYTRSNGQPVIASQPPPASFSNLSVKVATNTTVAVAANQVVMWNASNSPLTGALSATIDLGSAGAVNKLDTGTIAIDTWYAIWAISDGTTIGGLASTSFTAPTMPAGYTYKARIGAVQTIHASATLYGTWQLGKRAQYVVGLAQTSVLPVMTTSIGAAWTAQVLTRFAPPTASAFRFIFTGQPSGTGTALFAPNNSYNTNGLGGYDSIVSSASVVSRVLDMLLESTSIYWGGSGWTSTNLIAAGWDENL